MDTSTDLTLEIKLKDSISAELKKVKGEFSGAMTGMTKTAKREGSKIKKAFAMLDFRPFKDVDRDIKRVQAAYNRLARSGKLTSAELSKAKLQLKNKIGELRRETGSLTDSLSKAKAGLASVAAAGYAVIKAFSAYSSFVQKMAEVNTLLDISKEKYAALTQEILDLTGRIPQTAIELASAQYDIISAGVALEKSIKTLELSAKAAIAGVTDTKTAVNAGLGAVNAYGMSVDNLGEIYDILFVTIKKGVTTFPELAHHLGEILPSARAAGVGLKVVAASIAEMTKASIRTPQAATALKGAINAMAAPTAEAKKQFNELGIVWKGFIPTLKQIAEKSLSIDKMRLLIPDVEARTGVLALTQNMERLEETLTHVEQAAGAMHEAYDKMKDTPENQIKLFKNQVSALNIQLGAIVSEGLLPVAKGLREFIDSAGGASTAAKIMIGVLARDPGRFLNAWGKMRQSQRELLANIDEIIQKFEDFKDVKLPEDITGNTEEQLKNITKELEKAKEYWAAMRAKMELAGDAEGLKQASARLAEISEDLKKIGDTKGFDEVAKSVYASEEALASFEKAAQKAYNAAIKKAEQYARKVIEWEEKIKYARLSTEDKIRALQRKGTTDEAAWYDKQKQAAEKLSAAKEALVKKDYALAEKLAKDAESLYAGLAVEIKKEIGDESVVVKAIGQTKKVAIAGITEVGKFIDNLYSEQKDAAKEMEEEYRDSAEGIKSVLDDIVMAREAKIEITLDGLEDAKRSVEDWIKDPATKIIYIKTVEKKATGGRVLGMAGGGRFPGDSKQDSLWVRARPGEGFVRNEALSVWDRLFGPGFFEGINAPWSQAGQRIKAALAGNISGFSIPVPSAPRMAFAAGGRVPDMGIKNMGRIEISLGNKAYPVTGRIDVIEELKSALVREKLLRSN